MRNLLFILLLFFAFSLKAQETYTLTGTVSDAKGETLPGATVFLTNTRHITSTDNNGKFTFAGLEAGSYEVVVKMIGYVPYINKITVQAKPITITALLKEDNVELNTVTVKAVDPNRDKYLKLFTKYFIGEAVNANQCKILNPGVLNFHYDKEQDVLQASAEKILIIENQGLGYKLNYLLTDFKFDARHLLISYTGYPYFDELKGSAAQENKWAKNRQEAYLGSKNHFFRSVYNNTAEAEGFLVYALSDRAARAKLPPVPPTPSASLFVAAGQSLKSLRPEYNQRVDGDTTALFIFYKGGSEPYSFIKSGMYVQSPVKLPAHGQLSKIEPLTPGIYINKNGEVISEKALLVSGYWGWTKISELLPVDYGLSEVKVPADNMPPIPAGLSQKMNATIAGMEAYDKSHPEEHIYLHLNKPWYGRMDTIWFKAYTVNQQHKLSDKSLTAYAELIAPDDSVVQHITLQLTAGMAAGEFTLPQTAKAGSYRIRAWTNWMKNEGEGNYYERAVNIGGLPTTEINKTPATAATLPIAIGTTTATALQFFPEGGTLVAGVKSKVAFKAMNADGTAATVNGTISDGQGNMITNISSGYEGTGQFTFTPQAGKSYTAKVSFTDGRTVTKPLPEASSTGMVLSAEMDEANQQVNITVAAYTAQEKANAGFYVVASSGGKTTWHQAGVFNGQNWQRAIPQKQLPSGIARITLYNAEGEPMAERIIFIKNNDNLSLGIAKTGENANGETQLTIIAKTEQEAAPVMGSFSASVINEDLTPVDEQTEPTIISTLLLTAELHGAIHNPGYYLGHDSDIDLLMLTQGYRQFDWKKPGDKTPPLYAAEDGLAISGKILTNNGKPAAGAKVAVFFAAAHTSADTVADSEGRFRFTDLDIHGKMLATLKATTATGSKQVKIELDQPETKVPPFAQPMIVPSPEMKKAMQQRYADDELLDKQAHLLKEVKIKEKYDPDKKMAELLATSSNLNGPGHADQVIFGKDLEGCPELITCLIGKLSSITIHDNLVYDMSRGVKFDFQKKQPIPMTISVNGAIVTDVMDINPNDIYSIEALTSIKYKAIYGHDAAGGLLLITTKRGIPGYDALPREKAPGIFSFTYNGYYKARTFYQPKYSANDALNQPSAIYWKPDLLTDKDGKATLNFSNAGKGHYRVVVEGIDGEGRLGRAEYKYEVK